MSRTWPDHQRRRNRLPSVCAFVHCAAEPVRTSTPTALNFSAAAESEARSESVQLHDEADDSEDEVDPNKCDVCGVVQQSDADPKLVQPCDIHSHVYLFTCNRAVCVTCSRTKHPLRHAADDTFERGFFCRQHTDPTCYVLDGLAYGENAGAAIEELYRRSHEVEAAESD